MSKAFTKDDAPETEQLVAPRAPLPTGLPNYVTQRGLRLLNAERGVLQKQRAALSRGAFSDSPSKALAQRMADLKARIASAVVVDARAQPHDEVRFGATVQVRHEAGKVSRYRIVGVDEAHAAAGLIAFSSPLARALIGRRVGEACEVRSPRASEDLEVLEISYGDDEPEAASPGDPEASCS